MRRFFLFFLSLIFFAYVPLASAQMLTSFDDELNSAQLPVESPIFHKEASMRMTAPLPDENEMPPGDIIYPLDMAPQAAAPSGPPVDLQADQMEHDEKAQTITASGDVMMVQEGRIFRADKVVYDLKSDRVVASGDVVLNEESGDIHYSEEVELKDNFKDGFVKGLKTYLADGSRFTSEEGERREGTLTTMHNATYTPCEPCKTNPDKPPTWQLRASEVIHDSEEHTISYHNARLETLGVPVLYTPYFSHPDGTIKRKSGFLAPSGGYKSNLGTFVRSDYYWNIAPDRDATFGVIAMTEEAPMFMGEYRQRWDNAMMNFNGGITYSGRTDSVGTQTIEQDDEVRGHVKGAALWDINDKWRSGVNVNWASDDQYMRQYDLNERDVLENEIYAERFSGRNYAVGRLLTFQDIRVREEQVEQPEVVPEMIASFIGEPGAVPVIGGRWDAEATLLGLRRGGDGQDMNRLSLDGGWQRRLVSDYGFLTTVDASAHTDFYAVTDRDIATAGSNRSGDSFAMQFYPQLNVQSSYPLVSEYETMQATIEPIISLTIAPNVDVNSRIPNEDSEDVQIDASNIFEPSRFPGLDRVEDRSHITYGVRAGLYRYDGAFGDVFLGQSYRLDESDNPFPEGSGLDDQSSDVVGQVSAGIGDLLNLNYRFQLQSENLSSERHEVDASSKLGRFELGSRYLYAKGLDGTTVDENREQLKSAIGYYMTKDWRVRAGMTNDFGEENDGLREAYGGLDYFGQCLSWSVIGVKNYTDDASGESDTEILFTVGLKNLGGFVTSDFRDEHSME